MDDLFPFLISFIIILIFVGAFLSDPISLNDFYNSDRFEVIEFYENDRGNHYLRYYDKSKERFCEQWISYDNFMKMSGDFNE